MGYSFHIGNAVHHEYDEDGERWERWEVAGTTHPDAPTFPNDGMTGNGNGRHPSYSGWSHFCKDAGIYDLFFTEGGHLKCGHPGTMFITYDDLAVIERALEHKRETATLPPGFDGYPVLDKNGQLSSPDEGKYDGTLARLIWLEFWMRWALQNCENPGIQNT